MKVFYSPHQSTLANSSFSPSAGKPEQLVKQWCQQRGVPVVWNLAGGYQEDFQSVLDLHHATLEECLAAGP